MKRFYFSKLIIPIVLLLGFNSSVNAQTVYSYTGTVQTYTVPAGVTQIGFDVLGAVGGPGYQNYSRGGYGGRVSGNLTVTPGQVLYLYVGQKGTVAGSCCTYNNSKGGFNGGGDVYYYYCSGGGGASDIRTSAGTITTNTYSGKQVLPYTTTNRLVVAGGGGGASYTTSLADYTRGGDGGGLTGEGGWYNNSNNSGNPSCQYASGGSQSAGGYNTCCSGYQGSGLGVGGSGSTCYRGGGGGGGFYGGGGGYYSGGGGGSSFALGSATSGVTHAQGFNTPTTSFAGASTNGDGMIVIYGPTASATPSTLAFGPQMVNTLSVPPKFFTLSGNYLGAGPFNVASSCPNYLLSTDGVNWTDNVDVAYTGATVSGLKVYVKFKPTAAGTIYNCNLTITGGGVSPSLNVNVTGTGVNPCTGTPPSTIQAVVTPNTGGALTLFALSLTGVPAAGGLTYQWQVASALGGPYTNINGATLPTYEFQGITANRWYRCIVSCPSGGSYTTTGKPATLVGVAASSCTPAGGCNFGSYFLVASASTPLTIPADNGTTLLDNISASCPTNYTDRTATHGCDMSIGGTYNATVGYATSSNSCQIWIDFNNDGDFATEERVGGIAVWTGGVGNAPIAIPSTGVLPGKYRMRIIVTHGQGNNATYPRDPNIPPCPTSTVSACETRDYYINLNYKPCTGIPYAGIADASPVQGCQTFTASVYNVGQQLGPGLTYQWLESPSGGLGTFYPLPGATASVYTPTVTTTGTIYYRMRVTCANGFQNAETNAMALTKDDPPVVPTSSIGSFSFCTNTSINAIATPSGGTWSTSDPTVATVNASTGEINGIGVGNATLTYTLATGCYSIAPMTVNQLPAPIEPANLSVCQGSTITLTNATPGGSWLSETPPIATINSSTGFLTAIGVVPVTIRYTLPTGCYVQSVVTVNAVPGLFITGPSTGSYCADKTSETAVTLNGSNVGVNYQLIRDGLPLGTAMAGTGTALNFGIQNVIGMPGTSSTYTIFATNAATGCSRGMVASTVITKEVLPLTQIVSGGGSFCEGGAGEVVYLNGSQIGVDYYLYRTGVLVNHGFGPVYKSGNGAGISFDPEFDPGIYTLVGVHAVTGCSVNMASSAIITIDPKPTQYTVTGGGPYCAGGGGVHVGLSNSIVGIQYSLYRDGIFESMLSGTGTSLDFGLKSLAGYYTVEAYNTSTTCSNTMSGGVTVSVSLPPVAYNVMGTGSYCAGGTGRTISIDQTDAGVEYQVHYGGSPVGGIVSGTGLGVTFGDFTSPGIYTVKATDASSGCTSTMAGTANISINLLPTAHPMGAGGNYCVGATGVPVTLSNSTSGVNYQLYRNGNPDGLAIPGTGSALNFGIKTAAGVYTVIGTDMSTTCTQQMSGVSTVGVNPLPSLFSVTGTGAYCAGGTGRAVGLDYSNTGVSYQLYRGATPVGSPLMGSSAAVNFGAQTIAGTYTVKATNVLTGCNVFMTGDAVISINPLPTMYIVTGGGNYCADGPGREVVLNGSNTGINYQLNLGLTNVGSPVAGTGSAINFGFQTSPGTYTIVATDATTNCSRYMFGGAPIVANPLPTQFAMTGGGTYCAGGAGVHVGISSSVIGIKYQLMIDGSPSGTPLPGNGSPIDFGSQITPGTYTVMATNNTTMCTNNMLGSVVVAAIPLPTAYTVTGGGSYCAGGTGVDITLDGTDNDLVYQLRRGTAMVGTPVTGGGGSISFGMQTAGGSYTVVASDPTTGCSKTMNSSANVVINPLPSAFTVLGGGSYCDGGAGNNIYLSVSTAGIEYQLYNGATLMGTVTGTGSSVNFGAQTAAGTYTVIGNNPATSCSNNMSGSATITVNPLPASHNVIGGGAYCTGGTGVHVGLDNSDMGVKYQLFHGTSSVGTAVSGTGSAIDFGLRTAAGSYTVVATNTATTCANSQTGSATISISPLPTKYSVVGGGNYCETGLGVHIGISGSDIGTSYQLYHGTTPVGVALPGTGSALGLGLQSAVGMYTVVANNGISGCETGMNGSALVNTLPILIPHVNMTSSISGTVCEGQLVNFTASPVNGGASPTYQWLINGVSAGVGNNYSYIPLNGDVVTAVIHSTAQCAHPDTGSESMHMVVSTMQMPSASVTADPGSVICTGSPVTFTATSMYGGTSPVMTWLNNGVAVGTGNTYSYYPSNGDIITFRLGSNFNCRLADEVFAVPVTMTVENPVLPIVTVTSNVNHTSIAPGQSVTFTASVVAAGSHPTYQWVINSTPVAGANQPTFTTSNLMNKDSVTCEVTGICDMVGFNATKVTVRTTGISQVSSGNDIRLVPNPNKGEFTVRGTLATTADAEVTLEVTNMLGQTIYTNKVMTQNGTINEQIKLNNSLANGMYMLNLRSGADNTVFHFVIEQ